MAGDDIPDIADLICMASERLGVKDDEKPSTEEKKMQRNNAEFNDQLQELNDRKGKTGLYSRCVYP